LIVDGLIGSVLPATEHGVLSRVYDFCAAVGNWTIAALQLAGEMQHISQLGDTRIVTDT
jgi:16S rRNA C967 or C1407 C5-methylase (RsmB/RsmF family)